MTATERSAPRAPEISVIVPTVDRPAALSVTLDHLAAQTLPPDAFEVVVVDDGSAEPLRLDPTVRPFSLSVVRLERSGAAEARNAGADRAAGALLVFVDDDIALEPDALAAIRDAVATAGGAVVVGAIAERPMADDAAVREPRMPARDASRRPPGTLVEPLRFTECMTGFLAVPRSAFDRLGGFQDPTGGWPSWDDVDFGYRAHRAGLPIVRAAQAQATHRDAAQATFEAARDRWWRAAHSAAALFERYPELREEMPMFRDKTPIDWRQDGLRLAARKLARSTLASRPAMAVLDALRAVLHGSRAGASARARIEALLIRGEIARGLRAGLRTAPARGSRRA